MTCSFSYGAPSFLRKIVNEATPGIADVLPRSKRKCPRCKSRNINTGAELNYEMNEVARAYLKKKYPLFTFRPKFKTT